VPGCFDVDPRSHRGVHPPRRHGFPARGEYSHCRGMFHPSGTSERSPTWIIRDVWTGTMHELSVKSVWHVDRVFLCRVYIDSNRRDSQI
jgi:hypothetical protein